MALHVLDEANRARAHNNLPCQRMTGAVTTWIERLVKNADATADIFSSVKSFSPREEKSLPG